MQFCAESLFRRFQVCVLCSRIGIDCKNRRSRKAEQMIFFERFRNGNVHIAELTAVAFVEDNDDVLFKNGVPLIFFNEFIQFLNGRDDDPRVGVFHLPLQNGGAGVTVRRALFKAVVFLHRLIIQVLAVYDERHLVDIRKLRRELCGLERRERLASSRRVPDVAARLDAAVLLVGCGDFDAIENSLRCRDLIIKYRFNIGFVSLFLERVKPFSNGISQPQARYGHFTVCAHIHATAVASPPPCSLEILTFGYICPSSLYAIVRIRSP